jgi:predicted lipoprotein with Yx(FWY)xxD motif
MTVPRVTGRAIPLFAVCAAVALSAVSAGATTSAGRLLITTRKLPVLGTVLVDGKGRTLYMFVPDQRKRVTCVKACAVVWPPVKLPKGERPVAAGRAKSSLLGSDPDPAGGRVVTYAGWPLYRYVTDTSPGLATGQALNLNGGLWYVLAPSGKVIKTAFGAKLSAPTHRPKANTKWFYTLLVTDLTGKPLRARITVQIVDPLGTAHPVQYANTKKNLTDWPINGRFRDYVIWPKSSAVGVTLTLRVTVKAGTGKRVLTYPVSPTA